ncbi:MAG: hypothetical protein K9K32_02580 [Halanaerobiales bacterium]|nr:hypothetical protein [Halanaerobiales bacterium]
MNLKVTLIQPDLKIGKQKYNYKLIKRYLLEAVESQTDLIVLPETWYTGFGEIIFKEIEKYAKLENSELIDFLKDFAFKNDVYLVGGTVIEKERDGKYYNSLYFIDKNGKIKTKYKKIHLYSPGGENKVITPGHKISIVKTEFRKFGFMVCYDLRFPELSRLYGLKGVDVLFVVANFNDPKKEQWLNQLRARALENQYYVVACNRTGHNYFGNSVIINPEGEIILNAGREKGIYSGYLDLNFIEDIKKRLPLFNDRREDVYQIKLKKR